MLVRPYFVHVDQMQIITHYSRHLREKISVGSVVTACLQPTYRDCSEIRSKEQWDAN